MSTLASTPSHLPVPVEEPSSCEATVLPPQQQTCARCGQDLDVPAQRCEACEADLPLIRRFEAFQSRQSPPRVEVHWEVACSQEITLAPGQQALAPEGRLVLTPGTDAIFDLEIAAYNDAGQATAQVRVALRPPRIQSFTVAEEVISLAYPTIFSWEVADAEQLEIDGEVGEVTGRSFTEAQLSQPGTYTLTASNEAGSVQAQVQLLLPLPEVHHFFAGGYTIKPGLPNSLFWEVSNAAEVWLEPHDEEVSDLSRIDVMPDRSTTYHLLARNASGEVRRTLTLTLPPPVIHTFGGDEISTEGERITLRWETQNAHTLRLEPGVGQVPACGEVKLRPPQPYNTYTLYAEGHSGTTCAEFRVVRFPIPLEMEGIDEQFDQMLAMAQKFTPETFDPQGQQEPKPEQPPADTGDMLPPEPPSDDPRIRRVQEMEIDPHLVRLEKAHVRRELRVGLSKLKALFKRALRPDSSQ
jgi:hypothetical protein